MEKLYKNDGFTLHLEIPRHLWWGCKSIIEKLLRKLCPLERGAGFTLLLSVLISSIILGISVGFSTFIIRELTISAIGRESQKAFFAADSGIECALYWDLKQHAFVSGSMFSLQSGNTDICYAGGNIACTYKNGSAYTGYILISTCITRGFDFGSFLDGDILDALYLSGASSCSQNYTTDLANSTEHTQFIATSGGTWAYYPSPPPPAPPQSHNITCAGMTKTVGGSLGVPEFDLDFANGACAHVKVEKTAISTTISSAGHNTCNLSNPNRVERSLEVAY